MEHKIATKVDTGVQNYNTLLTDKVNQSVSSLFYRKPFNQNQAQLIPQKSMNKSSKAYCHRLSHSMSVEFGKISIDTMFGRVESNISPRIWMERK